MHDAQCQSAITPMSRVTSRHVASHRTSFTPESVHKFAASALCPSVRRCNVVARDIVKRHWCTDEKRGSAPILVVGYRRGGGAGSSPFTFCVSSDDRGKGGLRVGSRTSVQDGAASTNQVEATGQYMDGGQLGAALQPCALNRTRAESGV